MPGSGAAGAGGMPGSGAAGAGGMPGSDAAGGGGMPGSGAAGGGGMPGKPGRLWGPGSVAPRGAGGGASHGICAGGIIHGGRSSAGAAGGS